MRHRTRTATIAMASLVGMALLLGALVSAQPEPPVDLPSVPFDVETAIGLATDAGGTGVATFLFAEDVEPWAALVVHAGSPDGIDRVTVTLSQEDRTVTIEAVDADHTNVVTILVNKAFVDAYIASSENDLSLEVSDAVNYQGVVASADAGGVEVYVFVVTHFSVQSITLSAQTSALGTLLGPGGLTAMGWTVVGAALAAILVAGLVALRRRR